MMLSGKGLVQNSAKFEAHPEAKLNLSNSSGIRNEPRAANRRVDMVDSYFAAGVTSAAVTSVEHPGLDIGKRATLTGSANRGKAKVVSIEEVKREGDDQELDNGMLTTRSVAPPEMPGLSIITWDEFVEDPAMFYRLFSQDKSEFIHFDPSIVTNFFHDSRMDPPVLGGPSGDGMSW
ncbi:hypothetical protein ElyMa_002023800 [Elysia marginata]|uniref:HSF-type DNA-binding domain-containing protein n=1 Tax=Elysia marginata TaxID=1093978 RepID=A0AAV4F6W7_9GAST|nr:hypothetical protein ElyMa_002023800 [Elysia marginata]